MNKKIAIVIGIIAILIVGVFLSTGSKPDAEPTDVTEKTTPSPSTEAVEAKDPFVNWQETKEETQRHSVYALAEAANARLEAEAKAKLEAAKAEAKAKEEAAKEEAAPKEEVATETPEKIEIKKSRF